MIYIFNIFPSFIWSISYGPSQCLYGRAPPPSLTRVLCALLWLKAGRSLILISSWKTSDPAERTQEAEWKTSTGLQMFAVSMWSVGSVQRKNISKANRGHWMCFKTHLSVQCLFSVCILWGNVFPCWEQQLIRGSFNQGQNKQILSLYGSSLWRTLVLLLPSAVIILMTFVLLVVPLDMSLIKTNKSHRFLSFWTPLGPAVMLLPQWACLLHSVG